MSPAALDGPSEAAFARDGFVVIRGLLDRPELPGLRGEVDAVLAKPLPPGCERPHNTLAPLRWNDGPVRRALASRQRIARLAQAVGGNDLRWISGYVSVKAPGTGPLWWHQDWWCWDHTVSYRRAAPQVALLCYLSATDEQTAALRGPAGLAPAQHGLARGAAGRASADRRHLSRRPGGQRSSRAGHPRARGRRRRGHRLPAAARHPPQRRRATARLPPADLRAVVARPARGHPRPSDPASGPAEQAEAPKWQRQLLPSFDGQPRDLELNRSAPARFAIES